ncbi:rhamnogalacturonan acetylesterase [Marinigracilibium pacificum]|nr:rhamnogalacturonan acetylesterase [Marinigracilibium pacificum]
MIYMVGDSTMSDKPFGTGNPEKGWGQVFPLYFDHHVRVENHAVNGRSTKSFIDEGRWNKVLEKLEVGNYVFIQFGHNDEKVKDSSRYTEPNSSYKANLKKFVIEARSKGAIPVLATSIARRKFDENGKLIPTHGEYPEAMRQVAKELNVPLLDLNMRTKDLLANYGPENSKKLFLHIAKGEYESIPEGEIDNTHLSPYGAFRVADLAVAEIRSKVPELTKYLKD